VEVLLVAYVINESCIATVDAITSEDQTPDEWRSYIKLNADYYAPAAR